MPGCQGAQRLHQATSQRKSPRTEHFHENTAVTSEPSALSSTFWWSRSEWTRSRRSGQASRSAASRSSHGAEQPVGVRVLGEPRAPPVVGVARVVRQSVVQPLPPRRAGRVERQPHHSAAPSRRGVGAERGEEPVDRRPDDLGLARIDVLQEPAVVPDRDGERAPERLADRPGPPAPVARADRTPSPPDRCRSRRGTRRSEPPAPVPQPVAEGRRPEPAAQRLDVAHRGAVVRLEERLHLRRRRHPLLHRRSLLGVRTATPVSSGGPRRSSSRARCRSRGGSAR